MVIDATRNFWELNPQFKSIIPYKQFYEGNSEDSSSKVMWFIIYCYHMESEFYPMPEQGQKGKLAIVGKSICGSINFYKDHKKELDFLIEAFKERDTPGERMLRATQALMDQRAEFISTIKYDAQTWDMLDSIAKNTSAITKSLGEAEKVLQREKEIKGKGGVEDSLTEKGLI